MSDQPTGAREIDGRALNPDDGTAIAWRDHGDPGRMPLVLCNGAGCSSEYWTASLIPACRDHLRPIEWDYRGHYDSAPAADPMRYRVEDHAADLLALLDAAGIERAVFLGFSLGVQVVLEAFRRRPGAFAAVALVSGSCEDPLRTFGGLPALRPLLCAVFDFAARHPRLTARVTRVGVGGPLAPVIARAGRFCEPDVPRGPFRAYLRRAGRLAPIPYMRTLRLMGEHSARDVLPRLGVPALLIAGEQDTMTPRAVMEGMRDAIPGCEYLAVPDGRHTLLMTRGEWIAERVLDFLRRRGVVATSR